MSEIIFEDAPEVKENTRGLIEKHHTHLAEAKISYLTREGPWQVNRRQR